jgi:hypothetical protein
VRNPDRQFITARLAEMKTPPAGKIELRPRDHPVRGAETPFGIVEILSADDRHGCRYLFRRLVDSAIDAAPSSAS